MTSPQSAALRSPDQPIGTPVLLLMAVTCGLCAGGNYFNQPLLHSIAVGLNVSEGTAASTVTIAQVSYAIGLLLLVPLGDMLERRRLAVVLTLLAAIGQFISGFAQNIGMLAVGTAMAGLFSVAAQVLVPLAATLSAPEHRGRAVGLVMSGLLTGILAARSVAGLLSSLGGWSTVYLVAGSAMIVIAALLWRVLPDSRNPRRGSYGETLRSLVDLLQRFPRLRSRTLLGGLAFASVSSMFSTMALLLSGPAFGLGDGAIGLVGLAGVTGALMASFAGRLADRGFLQSTSGVAAVLLVASWGVLWLGGSSLMWFIAGLLLIDIALQGVHISNQNVVYALMPEARSRLNAVYMTGYFIGAAAGSAAGSFAFQQGGWEASCELGAVLAAAGVAVWLWDLRLDRSTSQLDSAVSQAVTQP